MLAGAAICCLTVSKSLQFLLDACAVGARFVLQNRRYSVGVTGIALDRPHGAVTNGNDPDWRFTAHLAALTKWDTIVESLKAGHIVRKGCQRRIVFPFSPTIRELSRFRSRIGM